MTGHRAHWKSTHLGCVRFSPQNHGENCRLVYKEQRMWQQVWKKWWDCSYLRKNIPGKGHEVTVHLTFGRSSQSEGLEQKEWRKQGNKVGAVIRARWIELDTQLWGMRVCSEWNGSDHGIRRREVWLKLVHTASGCALTPKEGQGVRRPLRRLNLCRCDENGLHKMCWQVGCVVEQNRRDYVSIVRRCFVMWCILVLITWP